MFSAVKDEDSDMDVPEDEGSDSDMEESRPSKPRPTRNGITAGTQTGDSHFLVMINYLLLGKMLSMTLIRFIFSVFKCSTTTSFHVN